MAKKPHVLFFKTMITLAGVSVLGAILFFRGTKPKSAFTRETGVIAHSGKSYADYPARNGKFHYLLLEGNARPFELFIGKDPGDFSPAYEKLDGLQVGDTITIYHDELLVQSIKPVNKLAYFIDKGKTAYFIKGSRDKYFAYFIWGFCLLFSAVMVILKRKGIIY